MNSMTHAHAVGGPLFKGCHSYKNSIEELFKNIREANEVCMGDEPSVEEQDFFA